MTGKKEKVGENKNTKRIPILRSLCQVTKTVSLRKVLKRTLTVGTHKAKIHQLTPRCQAACHRLQSARAHVVSLMIVSQFLIICLPATGGKQPTTVVVAAHHQGGGRPATTVVGGSPLRWWAACHRWSEVALGFFLLFCYQKSVQ